MPLSIFSLVLLCAAVAASPPPKVILHITVDDLGWHNVDWHRNASDPERATPNMEALARQGIILDGLYGFRMCTPSRTSFLSGRLPVHVNQELGNPEDSNTGVPYNMTTVAALMKQGGFQTHVVGKWDAGMATPRHTPEGRGFDSSLIYFNHKNDYWTQTVDQGKCMDYVNDSIVDLWDTGAPARNINGTAYEEYFLRDRILDIISSHNEASGPLFIYYAPHIVHCPLQVPQDWLQRWQLPNDEAACQAQTPYIFPGSRPTDYACRSQHTAMLNLWDTILGNVTAALSARGWLDDALITLHSDNGGAIDLPENAANNFPLRGGKYSEFGGGVQVTGFVSGGFLPAAVRGRTTNATMHVADWLATYSFLAGVTPTDPLAAAAGLPPFDSVNLWPFLSGSNSTPPRLGGELPLSSFALLSGAWKYLNGTIADAGYEGPIFPNASSPASQPGSMSIQCKDGCLFNLEWDPHETTDYAKTYPAQKAHLASRLHNLSHGFYQNHDNFGNGVCGANVTMDCACYLALPGNKYNGFLGPWALLESA